MRWPRSRRFSGAAAGDAAAEEEDVEVVAEALRAPVEGFRLRRVRHVRLPVMRALARVRAVAKRPVLAREAVLPRQRLEPGPAAAHQGKVP